MKNLTLRVDGNVLERAREIAHSQSTSINALVRGFLGDLVRQETRRDQARKELLELCQGTGAKIGDVNWTRESLYDR